MTTEPCPTPEQHNADMKTALAVMRLCLNGNTQAADHLILNELHAPAHTAGVLAGVATGLLVRLGQAIGIEPESLLQRVALNVAQQESGVEG